LLRKDFRELIVDDTVIMFMISLSEWKAEDQAVAGDTEEEVTRCSSSHDRGHHTVQDR
jgi:hypothetical protein